MNRKKRREDYRHGCKPTVSCKRRDILKERGERSEKLIFRGRERERERNGHLDPHQAVL